MDLLKPVCNQHLLQPIDHRLLPIEEVGRPFNLQSARSVTGAGGHNTPSPKTIPILLHECAYILLSQALYSPETSDDKGYLALAVLRGSMCFCPGAVSPAQGKKSLLWLASDDTWTLPPAPVVKALFKEWVPNLLRTSYHVSPPDESFSKYSSAAMVFGSTASLRTLEASKTRSLRRDVIISTDG